MKVNNLKRISIEDFEQEDQDLVNKLAFAINPLFDLITSALAKNLDFDNLNQETITFDVEVDSAGKPKAKLELRNNLKTKPKGLHVIRAENLQLDGTFPTAAPFVTISFVNNNLSVEHVAGIPPNKKYRLTVVSIG